MLGKIAKRKSLVVLGLNSGTSADGLDLAAVRITRARTGLTITFLAGHTVQYPAAIRHFILRIADSENLPVADLVYLENLLGTFYGKTAKQFIGRLRQRKLKVDAIASHGQTVRHLPKPIKVAGIQVHGTLQLGSLARIAALTNCVTVGDFRQGDIAIGGEGAPITVAAMSEMFRSSKHGRLIANVGGMSNYFFFPPAGPNARIQAADCGPGNVLSDLLCRELFGKKYDRNGAFAAQGNISLRLLSILKSSPYFTSSARSTGREEFGQKMAIRMIELGKSMRLSPKDVIATATELTAQCIATAVAPLISRSAKKQRESVGALYLTGGGSHNKFLCRRLCELTGGLPVTSVRDLGMNPDLVEATAFAVMGAKTLWSTPTETRFDRTRTSVRPVLGAICQPPARKRQGTR